MDTGKLILFQTFLLMALARILLLWIPLLSADGAISSRSEMAATPCVLSNPLRTCHTESAQLWFRASHDGTPNPDAPGRQANPEFERAVTEDSFESLLLLLPPLPTLLAADFGLEEVRLPETPGNSRSRSGSGTVLRC